MGAVRAFYWQCPIHDASTTRKPHRSTQPLMGSGDDDDWAREAGLPGHRAPRCRRHCCYLPARQFDVLFRKNIKVLAPCVFLLLLLVLDQLAATSLSSSNLYSSQTSFEAEEVAAIPECIVGPGQTECYTLAWVCTETSSGTGGNYCSTHGANTLSGIMANNANLPGGAAIPSSKVVQWSSSTAFTDDLAARPNVTQAGIEVHFESATRVYYSVRLNQTSFFEGLEVVYPEEYFLPRYQAAVQRELFREIGGWSSKSAFSFKIRSAPMPRPQLLASDVVPALGVPLVLASVTFNFVGLVSMIVHERERNIRQAMMTMGLSPVVYWATWVLSGMLMNTISVVVLVFSGIMFGFSLFTVNDFGTYFWTLVIFSNTMVPGAVLVSHALSKARHAITAGFLYFSLGYIVQVVLEVIYTNLLFETSPTIFTCILVGFSNTGVCMMNIVRYTLALYPPVLLSKALYDLNDASDEDGEEGISFWEIAENTSLFPILSIWGAFLAQGLAAVVLAAYIDGWKIQGKPWYYPLFCCRGLWRWRLCCWSGAQARVRHLAEGNSTEGKAGLLGFCWPVVSSPFATTKALVLNTLGPLLLPLLFPPLCGTYAMLEFSVPTTKSERARGAMLKVLRVAMVPIWALHLVGMVLPQALLWMLSVAMGLVCVLDSVPYRSPDISKLTRSRLLFNMPLLPADVLVYFWAALLCLAGPFIWVPGAGLVLLGRSCRDKNPVFKWPRRLFIILPPIYWVISLVFIPFGIVAAPAALVLSWYLGAALMYESFRAPVNGQILNSTGEHAPLDSEVLEEAVRLEDIDVQFPNPNDDDIPAVRLLRLRRVFASWSYISYMFPPLCLLCAPVKKRFAAVRNVTFDVKHKELLCLLGPNGAGKSTTFNMLAGNIKPSAGRALVYGHDVLADLSAVHGMIGVCPQFDLLFDELSGREHLRLYAALKGLPEKDVVGLVEDLLCDVNLQSDGDSWTLSYSGGMKRRLSVCIALLGVRHGRTRIVFLDEPTTGMDPVSRRLVWGVIEDLKKKATVILTSHSMEEADVLGDRIAIIARGRLKVLNTSLGLKQKYGTGYQVTLVADPDKISDAVSTVEGVVGSVKTERVAPHVVSLSIPRVCSGLIPDAFKEIEAKKEELGVSDVQISLATLEEVFMKIVEHAEKEEEPRFESEESGPESETEDSSFHLPSLPSLGYLKGDSGSEVLSVNKQEGRQVLREARRSTLGLSCAWRVYVHQLYALLTKNAKYQSKMMRTNACQLLTPVVLIALVTLLQMLINEYSEDSYTSGYENVYYASEFETTTRHFNTGFNYTILAVLPSTVSSIYESSGALSRDNLFPDLQRSWSMRYISHGTPIPWRFTSSYGRDHVGGVTMTSSSESFDFTTFASKEALDSHIYTNNVLPGNGGDVSSEVAGAWVINTLDESGNGQYDITVMYNYTLTRGRDIPQHTAWLTNAFSRSKNGIVLQSLGFTHFPSTSKLPFDLASLLGPVIYMLVCHQLLPVVTTLLAYEKENKLREIMLMMGLKKVVYILANYAFGLVLYAAIVATLVVYSLAWFWAGVANQSFFSTNYPPAYIILLGLWGPLVISLGYCLSALFNSARTATIVAYFYTISITIISTVWMTVLRDLNSLNPWVVISSLQPSFAFARGLDVLSFKVVNGGRGLSSADFWAPESAMWEVYGYMIVHNVVFFILGVYLNEVVGVGYGVKKHPLFCVDPRNWLSPFLGVCCRRRLRGTRVSILEPTQASGPEGLVPEPDDVHAARVAVNDASSEHLHSIRILNLRKVYPARGGNPPFEAVKNLSLGIERGECFGMLGPNGAGKTTVISMLSGLFQPSGGNAYFDGRSIRTEMDTIHGDCGVCPQHDVLWETLSAADHLRFYGRMKGLWGLRLKREVTAALRAVNLYKQRNKPCDRYSGGQKRRLSVAISMMGRPKYIFLDEPSTGLDPASRRTLWDVILAVKKTTTVIITTHSMEEAGVLCDRIGIFVGGELRTLGHGSDLKARFGSGYNLTVSLDDDVEPDDAGGDDGFKAVSRRREDVAEWVMSALPSARLVGSISGVLTFTLPKDGVQVSQVFSIFEAERGRRGIRDWAIANSTLEEVFLAVASGATATD